MAAGLLLLRATIGLVALLEGGMYLRITGQSTVGAAIGAMLLVSGAALIAGLFTAPVALAIGLTVISTQLFRAPPPPLKLLETLPAALIAVVAFALVLIGPGAWSVDARLFGFREISIPGRPIDQTKARDSKSH